MVAMLIPKQAERFVEDLSRVTPENSELTDQPFFNPWRQACPLMDLFSSAPADRRARLLQHLSNPEVELVLCGEAPGYQGCKISGMAFTSERLLLEGSIPGLPMLVSRISRRGLPYSEPSATIVWGTLKALGLERKAVLWNAFSFHPHKPGEPLSNRTPTKAELRFGGRFLERLLSEVLPKGTRLIAVGGKAAQTLRDLGFKIPEDHEVRHPSMGGANKFREQMATLFSRQLVNRGDGQAAPWIC